MALKLRLFLFTALPLYYAAFNCSAAVYRSSNFNGRNQACSTTGYGFIKLNQLHSCFQLTWAAVQVSSGSTNASVTSKRF